jgi:hypothetical protein
MNGRLRSGIQGDGQSLHRALKKAGGLAGSLQLLTHSFFSSKSPSLSFASPIRLNQGLLHSLRWTAFNIL